eukprot:Partr_v1_DN26979_c1_g1_i1_m7201
MGFVFSKYRFLHATVFLAVFSLLMLSLLQLSLDNYNWARPASTPQLRNLDTVRIDRLLFRLTSGDKDRANTLLSHLSEFSISRSRKSSKSPHGPRGILSSSSVDFTSYWTNVLVNNICYSLQHDIPFFLDTSDIELPTGMAGNYRKIISLQRHVDKVDTLLWLDMDTIIMRPDIDIFSAVEKREPNASFIMADHSIVLNNGVFFLRNSGWSRVFLEKWMGVSKLFPDILWSDNGSLYLTIVDYFSGFMGGKSHESGKEESWCPLVAECAGPSVLKESELAYCSNRILKCLGSSYNNRITSSELSILPQDTDEFRLNQWWFGYHAYGDSGSGEEWFKDDYYRCGDPIMHTKRVDDVLKQERLLDQCRRVDDEVWMDFLQYLDLKGVDDIAWIDEEGDDQVLINQAMQNSTRVEPLECSFMSN